MVWLMGQEMPGNKVMVRVLREKDRTLSELYNDVCASIIQFRFSRVIRLLARG